MIVLYDENETNFDKNGICVLTPFSCEVYCTLEGEFGFEMTVSQFDEKTKKIKNNNIIKIPTPTNTQLFRITNIENNLTDICSVSGTHITQDLLKNIVLEFDLKNATCKNMLDEVLNKAEITHRFTGYSDLTDTESLSFYNKNCVSAINDIANIFSGEIVRDNFVISIKGKIGQDRGVYIRYGKNLTGLNVDTDYTNVVNRVYPIANASLEDEYIMLDEKYINSPNYAEPTLACVVKYNDLKVGEHDDNGVLMNNITAIKEEMRRRVNSMYLNDRVHEPEIHLEVQFILLADQIGYEWYKPLEKVELGDIVTVEYGLLNMKYKLRCIRYKYDAVNEKYVSIELGNAYNTLTNQLTDGDIIGNNINNSVSGEYVEMQIQPILDDIALIKADIINLYNITNNQQQQIDGILIRLTSAENEINKIKNDINTINNNYTNQQNEINKIKNDITNLQNDVNDLKNNVNNANAKIGMPTDCHNEGFTSLFCGINTIYYYLKASIKGGLDSIQNKCNSTYDYMTGILTNKVDNIKKDTDNILQVDNNILNVVNNIDGIITNSSNSTIKRIEYGWDSGSKDDGTISTVELSVPCNPSKTLIKIEPIRTVINAKSIVDSAGDNIIAYETPYLLTLEPYKFTVYTPRVSWTISTGYVQYQYSAYHWTLIEYN